MPLLLDTFCKAGGCSRGYVEAGFEVVGVDIEPQKNYPYRFIQADALEFIAAHGHEYDVIHASPPCQAYSKLSRCIRPEHREHPDLVDPVRQLLKASGKPYVIENVMGAPLHDALMLCGTMFRLKVIRHRLFESSVYLMSPGQRCWHPPRGTVGKAGMLGKKVGDWISVAGDHHRGPASHAMGIDWMVGSELGQAIPPAYTRFIGKQLLEHLGASHGRVEG